MERFRIIVKKTAERHIKAFAKSGDKASLRKIQEIIRDLENHPYEGVVKPEALKYELSGYWSRRINQKDRLVYSVHRQQGGGGFVSHGTLHAQVTFLKCQT